MSPVFYGFIKFWTGLFGNQQAVGFTHYPGHFLLLPYFFGWAKFFRGIIVEGAVLGAAALMFYNSFLDIPKEDRAPLRTIFSSWIHLVLVWTLISGLILLVNLQLPKLLESWLAGSPWRIMAFEFVVLPFIYVVILAVFFFTIPRVTIYKREIPQSAETDIAYFCWKSLYLFFPVAGRPGGANFYFHHCQSLGRDRGKIQTGAGVLAPSGRVGGRCPVLLLLDGHGGPLAGR